jgi:hypothetical protein
MPRCAIVLAALLTVALGAVRGQQPRYVPIPFEGNFESLFKERLQLAKEDMPWRELLNQIKQNPNGFNLDPALLKRLDLDNPALRQMLAGVVEKQSRGDRLTQLDLEGLKLNEALKAMTPLEGTGPVPPVPKGAGDRALPHEGPEAAAQTTTPSSDIVERWLRDLAHEADNTRLGDWLRTSPAFQKGLGDLKTLVDLEKGPSLSGLANLPEHLRITDKMKLGIGEGMFSFSGLPNISVPDMPRVQLPQIGLGSWNVPEVPLPNLGRPGGARFGEALLWGAALVALVGLGWHLAKNFEPRHERRANAAVLGPWPVDPARVATRLQLIMAFDYLAVLLLGTQVRTWNHRAIAREMDAASRHAGAAVELGLLYEQARYTTGPEPLSAADQAAARHYLCLLAGVAAS